MSVMDGYLRVSQVAGRTGDRFQSPSAQRDAISGWAQAHGVTIGQWHEDLDRSGGTMERPGMRDALRRIQRGESDGIIVARLDRFARTVVGGLTTIHQLHDQGARVVSVAENIDPATPMGRAMLGLLLIMGEWQRDQAREHVAAAVHRATVEGRYPTKTPYGYTRDEKGHVMPDPATAPIVRKVFEQRAAGVGWRKIADDLNTAGVPTPRGSPRWAHTSIMGIVQSPAATGRFVRKDVSIDDAWEAIVDLELWEAANDVRGVRDNDRRHHDRLLAGIARCAECRSVLTRAVNHHGFVSYACNRSGCGQRPTIGAGLLDEHVGAIVDRRLAELAVEQAGEEDGEAPLVTARDAAARELEAWRDDVGLRAVIGDADYRAGLSERAKARDATERALREHRSRSRLRVLPTGPDAAAFKLASLSWDRRRLVVEAYLHSVWVRKGTARGPAARRHLAERVRVVWMDDRDRPDIPLPSRPSPGPLAWPA